MADGSFTSNCNCDNVFYYDAGILFLYSLQSCPHLISHIDDEGHKKPYILNHTNQFLEL